MTEPSPKAAADLEGLIGDGLSPFGGEDDTWMGQTDCDSGCVVEPDGVCPHGFLSAARTLGVI